MSKPVMLINSQVCINCKACIVACQQRNNVPYSHSRNWIKETPSLQSPDGLAYQPGGCMHCQNAPCVSVCPTGATYLAANGMVKTDQANCIGCGACVQACPYHARFLHPFKKVADKCDYCGGQEPACVAVCPTGCRIFGDADDPDSEVGRAMRQYQLIRISPENIDTSPSLAYLESTVPQKLPPFFAPAQPVDLLKPFSQAVSWAGGIVLILLAGVMGKQFLGRKKSVEKPDPSQGNDSEEGTK